MEFLKLLTLFFPILFRVLGKIGKKRKWVAWEKICLSVEEGGLGMRDLSAVQTSLFMRFAGKLLVGNSLWAKFFKEKYVGNNHLTLIINSFRGSRFWKGVIAVMPIVIKKKFKIYGSSWGD